jgi:alpha-galactosidase/6-phospho-beta-glucosidase family protein
MEGDLDKALKVLALDPVVSHLTFGEIEELGRRLLQANAPYLPQFKGQLEG